MAKLSILAGTTSKRLKVFIQDSSVTTGAGLTGLVFNTASLTGYYIREGDASATAITLATATLGTWASGGFIVVDGTNMPGLYELDIPNAAIAAGAKSVVIMLKGATNMSPCVIEIELTANDNQVALPANSSLLSIDASGRVDAIKIAGTTQTAGDLVGILGALNTAASSGDPGTTTTLVAYLKQLINTLEGSAGIPTFPAAAAPANTVSIAEALNYIVSRLLVGIAIGTVNDAAATTTSCILDSGMSSVNDNYRNQSITFTSGTLNKVTRRITSYVGATRTATWDPALPSAPANGVSVEILGFIR